MAGRGDNNKKGSSGLGGGNQSNQAFGQAVDRGKSYHDGQTEGRPSKPQKMEQEQSVNRNTSVRKEKP